MTTVLGKVRLTPSTYSFLHVLNFRYVGEWVNGKINGKGMCLLSFC